MVGVVRSHPEIRTNGLVIPTLAASSDGTMALVNTSVSGASSCQMTSVRLYQPDDELAVRLPEGTGELGGYIRSLAWVCSEYVRLLNQDLGSFGLFIGVGIRPEHRIRLWCEQVGGSLPSGHWPQLVGLLEGAGQNSLPRVTAPVALAIECSVGHGPTNGFPEVPSSWADVVRSVGEPATIPDGLFELVFK